ncbi:MAG: primosomal protein N' [Clostridia bacterium]|nr:primosomal protein N' [Clostridia bacterium]
MIVKVLINTSIKGLNKVYDYSVPIELEEQIQIGKRVLINFGKGRAREEEGIIVKVEIDGQVEGINNGKKYTLKPIISVLDEVSYVDEEKLKFAKWMAYMYFCNVYDCIKLMLPPGITSKSYEKNKSARQNTVVMLNKDIEQIEYDIQNGMIKSPKHIRLLRFLIDNETTFLNDVVEGLSISKPVINTVEKNGYIRFGKVDIQDDISSDMDIKPTYALDPTPEQESAIKTLSKFVDSNEFKECLLFGVTGSGKTEVYLQVIDKVLKKGKRVIVLVPEISLTHQTVTRFVSRFGNNIAVLHSRMTTSKRKEEYRKIKDSKVNIVIGARSAIFAPISDIGLVIIDEEHDGSYCSQKTPRYSTKEVAEYICKVNNAVLLLGSATPQIDTYYKAMSGNIELITMENRPANAILPDIYVVDKKEEYAIGNSGLLSNKLKEEILNNIKNKEQTMIFLNRRGYSSYLTCKDCGYIYKCRNCDVTLTYHKNNDLLLCHYCSSAYKNTHECVKCSSQNIVQGGIGTQRIEEELKSIYNDISIARMDADTTVIRDAHQKILDTFKNENINVLVGTQMISKGHDIENVTLVGILGVDSLIAMNDYMASERAYSNISQVARKSR